MLLTIAQGETEQARRGGKVKCNGKDGHRGGVPAMVGEDVEAVALDGDLLVAGGTG